MNSTTDISSATSPHARGDPPNDIRVEEAVARVHQSSSSRSPPLDARDDHENYDLFGCGLSGEQVTRVEAEEAEPVADTAPIEEGGAGEVPMSFIEPAFTAHNDLFPPLTDQPDQTPEKCSHSGHNGSSSSSSSTDDRTTMIATAGATEGSNVLPHEALSGSNRNALQVASTANQLTSSLAYKMAGNAVDIVAVKNTDGTFLTTSWHVSFSWSRFRTSFAAGVGDKVRILVNGKELPTKMELLDRGRCTFITGGLMLPPEDLLFADLTDKQPNLVRFEHVHKYTNTVRYVDAKLHLWGPNESVVVVDLDGTLTISDVEGHIRTLRLGQYDFLHAGACDFFTKLHELGMRIVYLTARPLDWASASRTHLENAVQQSISLPPGVLITNSTGLTGALFTEVVNRTPHLFKIQVLNELQLTLIHAGRIIEQPVFVAGFGNRPTDIVAYEEVGMDPSLIFMLDPYSNVKAVSDPRIYESYSDPNVLLWLLPKLKHRVPVEKVGRIDDYTVRELVLADDREQLRMAELQARRLQQEEIELARQESEEARVALTNSLRASSRSLLP